MPRIIAGITLLAFVTALIGFPVPDSTSPAVAGKHAHEDYPCRDHACGCLDAEMCRTQCCCGYQAKRAITKAVAGDCCASGAGATCSIDQKQSARPVSPAINALGCKGLQLSWVSCGVVLSRPEALASLALPTAVDEVLTQAMVFPFTRSLKPSIPPPRA